MTPDPFKPAARSLPAGLRDSTVRQEAAPGAKQGALETDRKDPHVWKIAWNIVIIVASFHLGAIRGLHYVTFTSRPLLLTSLWTLFLVLSQLVGITSGVHRLWSHRSYKATWPLRTLLMVLQTSTFQFPIYEWARNHRVHHKFVDTDADPHNINRGFFFAHMGWLFVHKHPDVMTKGKGVDLSDLKADPIVMFQRRHYLILGLLTAFVVPSGVPWLLWGEDGWTAWFLCSVIRFVVVQHITTCINSVAHTFGTRPYDKDISPTENLFFSLLTVGEGWHNYHHTFPWDYKAAEHGHISTNVTAAFIDFFSRIGWAYDLKTASKEMVDRRMHRTGDGTHAQWANAQPADSPADDSPEDNHDSELWGWGDKDMPQDDVLHATIVHERAE